MKGLTTTATLMSQIDGQYFRNQKAILVEGEEVHCHACDGFGQVRFRFGATGSRDWKACATCSGLGKLPRVRQFYNRAGQPQARSKIVPLNLLQRFPNAPSPR